MNLAKRELGTKVSKGRVESDYSILLLLVGEPHIPLTKARPVTISKNPSSLDTVRKMLSNDVKYLMLLFWNRHNVDFQIFNFSSMESLKEFVYSDILSISKRSNYLYYSPCIPIEYPAILSAKLNSGIISPIWEFKPGAILENSEDILRIESK